MNITKFIKKLIPDNLFFFLKKNIMRNRKFFGLNNLDKKILKYLDYDNGFYIELGANDGISQSNTLHYEKYKNWKGILIEPIKQKFDQCINIRSKRNFFFNCACVSNEFNRDKIKLIYSNLRTIVDDENNLINSNTHISREDVKIYEKNYQIECEARTLNSILKEVNAPKLIDFFSLDTEGYEIEILKGINFTEYKFKFILIETPNINFVKKYLNSKEYELVDKLTFHDYLFKLKL
tara:strand:- start:10357 stop:11064 length:708 start_codon:yes stop_codon:yes gene_type:complete